jgi:hypothetical protein
VEDYQGGDPQGPRRIRLYDGPGQSPRPLRQPPSPGFNGSHRIGWVPSFLDDGRLIWRPDLPVFPSVKEGFHLTDLEGGHDVFVHTGFHEGHLGFDGMPGPHWSSVVGHRIWFLVYDHGNAQTGATSYTLYSATFAGALTKVVHDVAVLSVDDGLAAWVTTDGHVVIENAEGGPQHAVPVPLDSGCRVSPAEWLQNAQPFVAGRSVIALTERCGTGDNEDDELLAFDLSGHRLVHVTGLSTFTMSLGGDALLFVGLVPGSGDVDMLRYDLVTGTLARLGDASKDRSLQDPQGAGRYVLWYDGKGGHVGEFTD